MPVGVLLVRRPCCICGVICAEFLSAIALTAIARRCIARTRARGETSQVVSSYLDPRDVMAVCAVISVQSSFLLMSRFP